MALNRFWRLKYPARGPKCKKRSDNFVVLLEVEVLLEVHRLNYTKNFEHRSSPVDRSKSIRKVGRNHNFGGHSAKPMTKAFPNICYIEKLSCLTWPKTLSEFEENQIWARPLKLATFFGMFQNSFSATTSWSISQYFFIVLRILWRIGIKSSRHSSYIIASKRYYTVLY